MKRIAKRDIENFRKRLVANRAAILGKIGDLDADLRTLEEERETDVGDQAQETALASLLDRFEERDRAELLEIQTALRRIACGTYGVCERCGQPITRARLVAVPATSRCVCCHREIEEQAARATAASG